MSMVDTNTQPEPVPLPVSTATAAAWPSLLLPLPLLMYQLGCVVVLSKPAGYPATKPGVPHMATTSVLPTTATPSGWYWVTPESLSERLRMRSLADGGCGP